MKLTNLPIVAVLALLLATFTHAQSPTPADEKSIEEITRLAAENDAAAQFALSEAYLMGKGLPQDKELAVEWLSKSANLGYPQAQYVIGIGNYNGKYFPQDYKKAFEWFGLAAAQGHAEAKYNLGVMYKEGQGTDKNLDKAFALFSETAELGDKSAQLNLAGMYYFGEGVEKDYPLAYMWAIISDQVDLRGLSGNYAIASVSHSAPIAAAMSSAQLAKGRQLVSDWLARHPDHRDSGFR